MSDTAVRAQAHQWAAEALHFDEPMASMISHYIDEMPLSLVGMPYCPACESVLCGVCGHCHSLDVVPFQYPICPNDNEDMGIDCVAWWQAHKAVFTVQHMNEDQE